MCPEEASGRGRALAGLPSTWEQGPKWENRPTCTSDEVMASKLPWADGGRNNNEKPLPPSWERWSDLAIVRL
jgi:hypothetical protein